MKRFAIAAALATVIGLGTAGTADAQYYYRYGFTPNGGFATSQQYYGFGQYRTYNTYSSPYGGFRQQSYYGDVFGNRTGRAYGYSPFYGGYNRGYNYAAPSFYNPYGAGYGYNFYRR